MGLMALGEDFLSVSLLIEASDSCGMASLDTSSMDVRLDPVHKTIFHQCVIS